MILAYTRSITGVPWPQIWMDKPRMGAADYFGKASGRVVASFPITEADEQDLTLDQLDKRYRHRVPNQTND